MMYSPSLVPRALPRLLLAAFLALPLIACSDDDFSSHDGGSTPDLRADGGPIADGPVADGPRADLPEPADGAADLTAKPDSGPDAAVVPFEIRIMAANLTSGTAQSYTPGHGARIIKAFQPDIVLIQELNYGSNSPSDIAGFVKSTLGAGYHYYREGGQIPNGVISRWPILASGEWNDPEVSNRDFAWARIDIPGPKDLWAVSVHFLSSQASKRSREAKALIAAIEQHVPAGSLLVLGGDFNTKSRTEGCIVALRQRFTIQTPYPVDQQGNGNTNANRNSPYDWVITSPSLHALEVPLKVKSQTFTNGLVFDSREYTPLSDVPPVNFGDSDATQMQHMAVLRQFRIVP